MAITPLFISTLALLKQQLRLSGAANDDTLSMIDSAISEVRVGFYQELSSERISTILATSHTDTPTTPSELMRSRANVTELKWIRMLLLRTLPTLFQDNSGNSRQVWNDEGLAREFPGDTKQEIDKLQNEVLSLLQDLSGESLDEGNMNISVIEPDITPPRPGDSIKFRRAI